MDRSVKQAFVQVEHFLQDVSLYLDEERTSYTAAEFAQVRRAVMREWAERAEQLRNTIIMVYPDVVDDAYPEIRAMDEDAISEGAIDTDLDI